MSLSTFGSDALQARGTSKHRVTEPSLALVLERSLACYKGPDREGATGSTPHPLSRPGTSISQQDPGKVSVTPVEHGARARARRLPTFAVAIAQVPAIGIVGVVEAIVEGQPGDAGQQEQQDQEQQAHDTRHGHRASVSGARLESGAGWKEEKISQLEKPAAGGPGTPGFQHLFTSSVTDYGASSA